MRPGRCGGDQLPRHLSPRGAYPVPLPFIPGSDGMGLLLTQLATARGARVIGTVSTPEKEQLAREAGAAEVIRYTEIDHLLLPG
jgi:D-arabinose 1-dehydrogenase-like Zn-dependent alcohol dehydrogenase